MEWLTTCARKLLYTREDRGELGRWDPGSIMPERYGRAVRSAELRLRREILERTENKIGDPPMLSNYR